MIHIMIGGRLKELARYRPELPRFVNGRTSAVMLATDGGNRTQKVLLEATDAAMWRTLRSVKESASISVTGDAKFVCVAMLQARYVREMLKDANDFVFSVAMKGQHHGAWWHAIRRG